VGDWEIRVSVDVAVARNTRMLLLRIIILAHHFTLPPLPDSPVSWQCFDLLFTDNFPVSINFSVHQNCPVPSDYGWWTVSEKHANRYVASTWEHEGCKHVISAEFLWILMFLCKIFNYPCLDSFTLNNIIVVRVQIMELVVSVQLSPFSCYFLSLRHRNSPRHSRFSGSLISLFQSLRDQFSRRY